MSTGRTARSLTSREAKTRKVKQLVSGATTEETTKSGQSFMLTRPARLKTRVSIKTSDSTETDHSISDQDFQ